jgi:NodT family efflux transporter outer membrane factor (OMF) lipoprotein
MTITASGPQRLSGGHFVSLVTLIVLAGCSAPRPSLDHVPIAEAQRLPDSYGVPASATAADPDMAHWWRRFGDPTLATLAERTLAANQDIAQAAARVAEADAGDRAAAAQRLPTLGVSVDASRALTRPAAYTGPRGQLDASLDLGWDPDLFGGLASAHGAARARLAAAGYDLATVQRAAVAEVAANYVAYRGLCARIDNARAALATQRDLLDVIEHRAASGIAVESDVQQARLLLLRVSALVPQLTDARNQAANRIAVLIDVPPGQLGDLLDGPAKIPAADAPPAPGVPADLLRRRPDVVAAEQRVLAAAADVGVARVQLYPHLSLGGMLSAGAFSLPGLADSLVSSLIGGLTHNLFDGGRARAAVAGSRAAASEALAAYRSAILTAMEDVGNALSATAATAEWVRIDRDAVAAAERNAALTRGQYDIGVTDLFILLDAEQQLHDERDDLLVAETARTTVAIQLYVALGGGW